MKRLMQREIHFSPDGAYVACPDCDGIVEIKFSILTTEGELYNLGACGNCADGITVKMPVPITADEWLAMGTSGVPLFEVRRG